MHQRSSLSPELPRVPAHAITHAITHAPPVAPQVAAAGAACNLLLPFSHVRPALLKAGALPALAPLLASMLPELRLHAVWALKNLAHECQAIEQAALLQQLGWEGLRVLLVEDDDARVREQAVALLQNLAKGGDSVEQVGGRVRCGRRSRCMRASMQQASRGRAARRVSSRLQPWGMHGTNTPTVTATAERIQ